MRSKAYSVWYIHITDPVGFPPWPGPDHGHSQAVQFRYRTIAKLAPMAPAFAVSGNLLRKGPS